MNRNNAAKSLTTILAFVFIIFLTVPAISCGGNGEAGNDIGVVVTLLPQAEFVEKVGGDKVDVTVMVPPGAEPHFYDPTPSQMVALSRAEIYAKVGSGVDFELDWMDNLIAQNEDILVVDCSEGVSLIDMAGEHEEEEEDHEHSGMDPHIWMSPVNVRIMVQNICDGLVQVDPDNKTYYEVKRDAYIRELTQLDQDIRDGLSGLTNRKFMVYHPSFGYFAEEYDLTMIAVEEEGKEPTSAGIKKLIDQAEEYNIKVIFVSPQFNQQNAEVIASEIGGEVIPIDPLARDYITSMYTLSDELEKATGNGKKKEVFEPLSYIMFAIGVAAILGTGGVIIYHLVRKRKSEIRHGT
ncbi:metal ABC transporter solute-binding protein, Zn/Mn family [Chloroflexota bacterium]